MKASKVLRLAAMAAGAVGALAVGALAIGALAIGALSLGALAAKRVGVEHASFDRVFIRDLVVERLTLRNQART